MSELSAQELIRQIQISSRTAAGLPDYNPNDPIADPIQPQQQLKKVMQRFLNDDVVVPDSISFNSTIAYHWLLTSLTLHGSEIVNKTPGDLPLSDFLNFRVAWAETSVSRKLVEANLTGFPPDNFFFKTNEEVSSTVVEVPAHDGSGLSQPGTEKGFSEWEADFQFADAGDEKHVSTSSDHSTGISVGTVNRVQESESIDRSDDLSIHMDSLFGGAKNVFGHQTEDNLAAGTMLSDWDLDEQGATVSTREPAVTLGLDSIVTSEDDHSTSVDLFDDFQWKTKNSDGIESLTAVEEQQTINEDSFHEWDGFTGSEKPSGNVGNAFQITNTSLTENTTYLRENMTDSIDEWNDFSGSSSSQNPSNLFQNGLHTNAIPITIIGNTTISEEDRGASDYTTDVWNDFPVSSSLQDSSTKFWNEYETNDAHVTTKERETIKNDLFDDWNSFTGSSSLQKLSGNIQIESQMKDTCVTENTTKLAKNEAINDAWGDFTDSNNFQVPSINVEKELQSHVTKNTKKLEENGAMGDEWDDLTGSNSIQDPPTNIWNEWQTNDARGTKNMTVKKDPFEEFSVFTGSSSLQIPTGNAENESEEKDCNVTENTAMPKDNEVKNGDPISEWNGFPVSSILLDHSRNFQNELQTNGSYGTVDVIMSNKHKMIEKDSFDEWNDFTGSSIQVHPDNVHTELQTSDSSVTVNTTMMEEDKAKQDDPIDQWDCFTASGSLQEPSVDYWNQWQTNDPRVTEQVTEGKEHKAINDDEWNNFTGTGDLHEPFGDVEMELQINNTRNNENLMKPNENKAVKKEEWNGVTSSNNLQDPSTDIWNEWHTNGNLVTGSTLTSKEMKISDPFDELNVFTGSSSLPDPSANVWNKNNDFPISRKVSVENDIFSSNSINTAEYNWSQWQVDKTPVQETVTVVSDDKTENDDSLDEWDDFTGAGGLQDSCTNVGSGLQINDTFVTDAGVTSKEQMVNDDPFDEWNDFTGSSNLQNSSGSVGNGNNETSVSDTKSAEIDIFSFALENFHFTSMSNKFSPSK